MRSPTQIPLHKTLEDCRELVFSHVQDVHEEYQAKGWLPARLNLNAGVVRGILEIFAWVLFAFYQVLARALPNAFPLQASDAWLDLHGDQITLERRASTKATGNVTFTRAEGVQGNIPIPKGRIVRTRPDGTGAVYRSITTEDVVLQAEDASVRVPVVAEEYGQRANVTAGQIIEIVIHIPGIGGVTNDADWLTSEGADVESDAQLQERYTLAWLELAGCTAAAYKSWALSVPGVQTVAILDQHPRGEGTVDIIVRGTAGIPTETLQNKVRDIIREKAPVNDDWQVRAPVEVKIMLLAELEVTSGSLETAIYTAENRLRALFAGSGTQLEEVTPFGIGDDFTRDKAVAATVGSVDGLKRLVWQEPEALVHVPHDGLATLESLQVTARMVDA